MDERLTGKLLFALSAMLLVAELVIVLATGRDTGWMLFAFFVYVAFSGMLLAAGMMLQVSGNGIESVSMRRARALKDEGMKDILAGYEVDEEFLHGRQVRPQPGKSNEAVPSGMPLEQAIRAHADLFGGLEKLHGAVERFDDEAFRELAGKAGISGVSRAEVLEKIGMMACAEKDAVRENVSRSLDDTIKAFALDRGSFDEYISRCMTTSEKSDDSGDDGFSVDLDVAGLSQGSSGPPSDWSHDPKAILSKLKKPGARP
ncbi:MAG: hypothetical protein K9I59_00905 [Chlorobium sp.]|jgi:hypothetical protein|uniref:hypothetical protein n=1 Tax=Chlorobium sp. TaxID=1095 RepID=UPI0025C270EC|nr:hypothetical protein [Chlorobium sp.]MCF8215412.1 hypothetical protein [Chlorobium sp.]MCF8270250.1 hypothetical protein [Chlorobium sp.]MCF8286619.1 hypothetical protein [Chlorobium sp.]MCF8290219.1 hypothetical protein [Chlorobium sp.]MCF8384378.1 hypothetical protein [Chlorobium sp.]